MNENPKHAVARSTAGDRTRPHARPARHPELSATLLVRVPRMRTRAELARGPADARRLAAAFSGGLHAYVVASGDLVADVAAVARVLHEGAPYAPAR